MKRRTWTFISAAAIVAIALPAFIQLPATVIWNASPSVPIGLYRVVPTDRLEVPNLVAVDAPGPLKRFAAGRGYLPPNIPLLKRVAALPGQTVCRIDHTILVDGIEIGAALDHDRFGRPMPVWQGCRRIADDKIFLMNWDVENSLDGRYLGPIPVSSIIGTAVPLWTDEDGSDRYRWRVSKE